MTKAKSMLYLFLFQLKANHIDRKHRIYFAICPQWIMRKEQQASEVNSSTKAVKVSLKILATNTIKSHPFSFMRREDLSQEHSLAD